MATLRYAGIGARATPGAVLADMEKMAGWLARTGWHLSSGGADGADSAFAAGVPAGQRTVWLPWRGYNGHRGPDCLSAAELEACMAIAAPLHPAWERCSPGARKLHARNVAILLMGERPVDVCIAWSERGAAVGGMGIRIAEARGIPVLNLGSMSPRAAWERLAAIRRFRFVEGERSASRASARQGGGSGSPAPLPGTRRVHHGPSIFRFRCRHARRDRHPLRRRP